MYALKFSHLIKERTGAEVYQMYIDMRCFGEGYEEFYNRISEEGVRFIRGKVAKVTDRALSEEEKGKLLIYVEDTLLGSIMRIPVDMVILCTALKARSDAEHTARLFNLTRRADGFFLERHVKLDPVATPTAGIFIVGCCQSPKDIPDTVAQASAGAAEALAMISKGKVKLEAAIAEVDETLCRGCGLCVEACPYGARELNKERIAEVVEVLCQGCGVCAAVCPSGASSIKHFTKSQIISMVDALALTGV